MGLSSWCCLHDLDHLTREYQIYLSETTSLCGIDGILVGRRDVVWSRLAPRSVCGQPGDPVHVCRWKAKNLRIQAALTDELPILCTTRRWYHFGVIPSAVIVNRK